MGLRHKTNNLNLVVQGQGLKRLFPDSKLRVYRNTLTWISDLTPSPLSDEYKVKLIYKSGKNPRINVLAPELIIPEGTRLPHTYPGALLCLYYPKAKEWQADMHLYKTVVPWISEWLIHYEIWIATGEWCGGGMHPNIKKAHSVK